MSQMQQQILNLPKKRTIPSKALSRVHRQESLHSRTGSPDISLRPCIISSRKCYQERQEKRRKRESQHC